MDNEVRVTDIDIKFWSLAGLMIKCAFAIIPAAIVIAVIYAAITVFGAVFIRGLLH